MALDLIGGPVFTVLFEGVKLVMGRTETFKELLRDLNFTLECLRRQATAIQQIGQYNAALGLPNDEIEDLERQMYSGTQLVFKLLNFRLWNYCCINCYTDQLVDLDRSLRRLLENLMLQEIRDVKEILDLSRKNRKELEEVKEVQLSMHKILEQIAGVMKVGEASTSAAGVMKVGDASTSAAAGGGNIQMVTDQNEGNYGDKVASLEGGTRTALGAIFGKLLKVVIQVKDKNVMFKPLLEYLKSTLESLKPLIEEMAQHNKVLDRPKEELQRFALQMESGVEVVYKCSKVRLWASYKKYEYTNRLLGLDEFCRRQLRILREQVARDVKETSVSIRNVKEEILVLISKTATVVKPRKRSSGVVQKSYDKSRLSILERYDRMSDVLRQKSQHFRPIGGGAPFITCDNCFTLLRIPTGFLLSKRRCHKLRCGVCLNVHKFSLHPYKVLSDAEPPTCEVDNLSSNPASTYEKLPDDRFSYLTTPGVYPGIFTPSDSLHGISKKSELWTTDIDSAQSIDESITSPESWPKFRQRTIKMSSDKNMDIRPFC